MLIRVLKVATVDGGGCDLLAVIVVATRAMSLFMVVPAPTASLTILMEVLCRLCQFLLRSLESLNVQ